MAGDTWQNQTIIDNAGAANCEGICLSTFFDENDAGAADFVKGFKAYMVVFSIILMAVVLFFRKGIMGDKEFDWDVVANFFRRLFHGKKPKTPAVGGDAE